MTFFFQILHFLRDTEKSLFALSLQITTLQTNLCITGSSNHTLCFYFKHYFFKNVFLLQLLNRTIWLYLYTNQKFLPILKSSIYKILPVAHITASVIKKFNLFPNYVQINSWLSLSNLQLWILKQLAIIYTIAPNLTMEDQFFWILFQK